MFTMKTVVFKNLYQGNICRLAICRKHVPCKWALCIHGAIMWASLSKKAGLGVMQNAFWAISHDISSAGVTGKWRLVSHAENAVRWLALFQWWKEAPPRSVSLCTSPHDPLGTQGKKMPISLEILWESKLLLWIFFNNFSSVLGRLLKNFHRY